MGGEYDLEPADQRPHRLDSKGEMKPSERNSPPPKISPAERRKLIAIGVKAGKSRRLIAQELNVTRPPEMDEVKSQGRFRGEEVCALWLARWLAAWAPEDKQLRNDVLDQARARPRA